ncbi:hypothetical protein F511_42762 [Dorcoceras hygrometricum]|uniref:Aminotransferase-like plant mobile domain-containing protein n=1 Tax=Dorcoceras hygrometricum TaxID=472368 RepID=A0A2Z7CQ16_9LAMI|nr:hypothetical protein F511_42762 [Dorcoceras hygrometricum]
MVKQYEACSDEPSVTEHIMFLWVLVCQYIFCPISGKPSSEYLPLACSLSTGKVYNLGTMLLGYFYQGMSSGMANNPLSRLGGVAWLLQTIWSISGCPSYCSIYPLDISHLGSEIENGRFSKTSVELLSAVPSLFLNPVRVYDSEDESAFHDWWNSRCAVLVPTFSYPPGKKSIIPARSSDEQSPDKVKVKKQKFSSVPSRPAQSSVPKPILRSRGRQYSTRSSYRLVSSFSNTDDDPIDLVSSPPASGDGGGAGNGDDSITTPDSLVVYEDVPGDDHFTQEKDVGLASGTDHPSIAVVTVRTRNLIFSD